jgi:hypothetical protein
MVQGQFTNYGGGFNSPVITPGIQNLQFNLAYWVVPVPLPFGETVLQATDREISLLKARMNDVYAVTRQNMARLMFTNNTANPTFPDSYQNAFDNGTNFATYGGINRNLSTNTAFQGQYVNMATGKYSSTYSININGFTRKGMSVLLANTTDNAGGEAVTYVVMNPGDYATLATDFTGIENVYVDPNASYTGSMSAQVRSTFPNLVVSGVPIFADHFVPQGNVFGVNVKYTAIYLSEDAAFDFSGFYSLVPLGQIGQQGVVVVGYDVITAKPSANFWAYGVGGNAF